MAESFIFTIPKTIERTTVSWQKNITCHLTECGCASSPFIFVSDKLQCMYFETPKTGSSSIKKWIADSDYDFYKLKASRYDAIKMYPNYYKFAVIRDPVERLLSNYKMFCLSEISFRHKQIEKLFQKPHDQISLDEFWKLSKFHKNHHWESLKEYIPISYMVDDFVLQLDLALITETLESDWRKLQQDLEITDSIGWLNSTSEIEVKPSLELIDDIYSYFYIDMLIAKKYGTLLYKHIKLKKTFSI